MLRFITWMDGWSFTSIVKGTYMYVCFKLLSFQKHRETDAAKKIGIGSNRIERQECLNHRNHEALGLLRRSSMVPRHVLLRFIPCPSESFPRPRSPPPSFSHSP